MSRRRSPVESKDTAASRRPTTKHAAPPRAVPGRTPVPWSDELSARAALVVEWRGLKVLAPRVVRLLDSIGGTGSIRRSATELGVGYRHALQWIALAEAALSRPLVERQAGGAAGGGAALTREGRALVAAYQRIDRKLRRIVASAERELVGSA